MGMYLTQVSVVQEADSGSDALSKLCKVLNDAEEHGIVRWWSVDGKKCTVVEVKHGCVVNVETQGLTPVIVIDHDWKEDLSGDGIEVWEG